MYGVLSHTYRDSTPYILFYSADHLNNVGILVNRHHIEGLSLQTIIMRNPCPPNAKSRRNVRLICFLIVSSHTSASCCYMPVIPLPLPATVPASSAAVSYPADTAHTLPRRYWHPLEASAPPSHRFCPCRAGCRP